MKNQNIISTGNQYSKVLQIANAIAEEIIEGKLKNGQQLLTINAISEKYRVARDTIKEAYKHLRSHGLVISSPNRGYFVADNKLQVPWVLLVFNKLSSFKKNIYKGFLQTLGKSVKVNLQIHYYNPDILKEIIQTNLGKYDYYVVIPHFYLQPTSGEILDILRMVPPDELILLDKDVKGLPNPGKAIYQDFGSDIYEALLLLDSHIKKYDSITLMLPKHSHHPKETIQSIKRFCTETGLAFFVQENGNECLKKKTIYFCVEDEDLAEIIKSMRREGWTMGTDVGIISLNETVLKELLEITVVTTDFFQMGCDAATMIKEKKMVHKKMPFQIIHRSSL